MRIKILIFAIFVLGSTGSLTAQNADERRESGRLIKVLAGDSIEIQSGNQKLLVKLAGVLAPSQQYAKESKKALSQLLKDRRLEFVQYAEDEKTVASVVWARVFSKGVDVGLSLLRSGDVFRADGPQTSDATVYRDASEMARKDRLGMWGISFKECEAAATEKQAAVVVNTKDPKEKTAFSVYGKVTLMVVINQDGTVASSRALCGHPFLQTIAAKAAMDTKFEGGREYLIEGTMTYNFLPKK